ncbi:hypothetical protein D3C80_1491020 [compost metagenome]
MAQVRTFGELGQLAGMARLKAQSVAQQAPVGVVQARGLSAPATPEQITDLRAYPGG